MYALYEVAASARVRNIRDEKVCTDPVQVTLRENAAHSRSSGTFLDPPAARELMNCELSRAPSALGMVRKAVSYCCTCEVVVAASVGNSVHNIAAKAHPYSPGFFVRLATKGIDLGSSLNTNGTRPL